MDMSSLWRHTHESLDNSLALFSEGLGKLKAAKSVDLAEVSEHLKTAAEAARNLRSLIAAALPEASWQTREEMDAVIDEIQRILGVRSRLMALATELERGSIVHRRAVRVTQLNQLREQAIEELRSQAAPGTVPRTLPGPEAEQWVDWACGLQEPEDAESLQVLRSEFAHLDEFITNLEPDMWVIKTESAV
jgi:hypothetical protein